MTTITRLVGTQSSPWEQATFLINGEQVRWDSPAIALRRGQENELKINVPWPDGTGINLGLLQEKKLVVEAEPAFGDWVSIKNNEASWKLTPENLSGRISLVFYSRGFVQVLEFKCWVLSPNLSDEGYATLGGTTAPIPEGAKDIWPGISLNLNFRANPESPIAGFPLTLSINSLALGLSHPVTSNPPLSTQATYHQWYLTGVDGTREIEFDFVILGQGMTPVIVRNCIKRSSNLLDYATIKLNGVDVPVTVGARFKGGTSETLSVVSKPGSPPLNSLYLYWEKGDGQLNGNYFKSDPVFNLPNNSMSWSIICPANSHGEFALKIARVIGATKTSFRCFLEP